MGVWFRTVNPEEPQQVNIIHASTIHTKPLNTPIKLSSLIIAVIFLAGCKKFNDREDKPCFIPYVDFVAHHVDPATLDVSFTSITSFNGTITGHHWDFGDGTSYDGQTPPVHHYPPPASGATATYLIKYTVSNDCGEAYWTQNITIGGCLPAVSFSYSFLNDSTVQFNNQTTSSTPVGFIWNFGDGGTSNSPATVVTRTYHNDQNFVVSLKATNSCGDNYYTATIPVCRRAVAAQTITMSSCATVSINASGSQNGARYQWDFGNGIKQPATPSAASTISYTYPAAGNYTITLYVINQGGCDTATVAENVNINGSTLTATNIWYYEPDDLDFNFSRQSVTNATTYSWNFGDGTTSSQQNPGHKIFAAPGNYNITLGASNGCNSYDFTAAIHVPYYLFLNNPPLTGLREVVYISPQQIYYLGSNGKLYRTDTAGNWSPAINLPSRLDFGNSTHLFKDINNNLWIYGKSEMARFNPSGSTWTSYFNSSGFSNNTTISGIAVDNNGVLWAVDGRQVRKNGNAVSSGNNNDYSSIAFAPGTGKMWVVASNRNNLYYANISGGPLNTVNVNGITGGSELIKVHPGGDIYLTTGTGILRLNSSGALLNNYNLLTTGGVLTGEPADIDFDERGNIWALFQSKLLKIPAGNSSNAKNYSFNADLGSINGFDVFIVSGANTDILLAKTTGNAATRIK